jgi:uncharacterized membrane protein
VPDEAADRREPNAADGVAPRRTEPRWPILVAVAVSIALQFALPNRHVLSPTFLFPAVEVLLLASLVISDPARGGPRVTARRRLTLALVLVMTVDNLAAVVEMVHNILVDSEDDTATVLLATGAAIWVTNVIAFSLWYWLLDGGGPAARASGATGSPSFAFAETLSADLVAPDWSPHYVDYLYLAFTNATAFSPTDTLPLGRPAKMQMLVQSAISLVIAVMIIARAVNILG